MRDLLVLGSGRSGTSMVAGTLSASGWWVGDAPYRGRAANRKGFFETAEINGINEELLARVLPAQPAFEHGQRWLATLASGIEPRADEALRARIARLVVQRPFAFKDPRLCYTLPAWEPSLPPGTGRVCVFREPAATAASIVKECADAPYLAEVAMDEERALAIWTCMYERVLAQCARGDWLFTHFDQLLTQDGLARLERFAGAPLDRRFPEASLRRSRADDPGTGRVAGLYRELCERAEFAAEKRAQVAVPAATPELSVILCTYQRLPILQRSIASFEAQDAPPGSFEIVVVDDGCSDGTCEWLDAHAFRVPARVLHKPNGGLASARNAGIAAARGRVLLFVNDDTLAFPDLVREHLRAHADLAARGVEAAVLGTFEQPSAHLGSALMRHLESSPEVFRYHDMRAGEFYDHNRFWTCNVSVATARVREAGLFDERFVRYGCEDIDLGLRLERLGLRVWYHAGARAHHEHLLDFAALRRRQLCCSASFVHLFAKHPSELDHPDWAWLAGRSVNSMQGELRARAGRQQELEEALATLARLELPPLEALGDSRLVAEVLERLAAVLHELNGLWWQAGFAQGLSEIGCGSFAELRAREPETAFGGLRGGRFTIEQSQSQLALVRWEAEAGEAELATLRAISLAAALRAEDALLVDVLSDLAVLRHAAGAREAALALLRRACELAPQNALVRENLDSIENAPAAPRPESEADPLLELARRSANLLRARVLWLGADAPLERLQEAGARSVQACTLPEGLELSEASIDVVIGPLPATEAGLSALARVLRPGGRWVVELRPCWWGAAGPLVELPAWAHLLLEPRELRGYLELASGRARADSALALLERSSRVDLAELRERLGKAGFDASALKARVERAAPPALARELERAHPGFSARSADALAGLLVRRGRTIVIGNLAAGAAGA